MPNIKNRKEVKSDEFVQENQIINIYQINSSARNLANEYNQEIYDYLTKTLEKDIQKD